MYTVNRNVATVLMEGHNVVQVFTVDEVKGTMEYFFSANYKCFWFASIALGEQLFHQE